jgi:hypothetical protein
VTVSVPEDADQDYYVDLALSPQGADGGDTADLDQVPTLYQPPINPDRLINALKFFAIRASEAGNYKQLMPSAVGLPGTINTALINATGLFQDFKNFVSQLVYQHVDAYLELMNVTPLEEALTEVRNAGTADLDAVLPALSQKLLRRLAMATQSVLDLAGL